MEIFLFSEIQSLGTVGVVGTTLALAPKTELRLKTSSYASSRPKSNFTFLDFSFIVYRVGIIILCKIVVEVENIFKIPHRTRLC